MEKVYNPNGLVFWNEREIRLRNFLIEHFASEIHNELLKMNSAWSIQQIEAPILTPLEFISNSYTEKDIFYDIKDNLVFRPETTPGSYAYAKHLLTSHTGIKPPFVIWQSGKSFRRETDHVEKHMRLKEFYQQEFQGFYVTDTENDYQTVILPELKNIFQYFMKNELRIVESDRLPEYSLKTVDIEVKTDDNWMELCSVSVRNDFKHKAIIQTKKKTIEKDLLVLEIAIGLDRFIYNMR